MTALGNEFAVAAMVVPRGGPKTIPMTLDFTAVTQVEVNAYEAIVGGKIEYIQSLFIDNSQNDEQLTVVGSLTGQRVIAPARSQGYYSIFAPNEPTYVISTTGGVLVPIQFTNIPAMPIVWNVDGGSGGPIAVTGPLTDTQLRASPVEVEIISAATSLEYTEDLFTLDGTNQIAIAAGDCGEGSVIYNPIGNNAISVNIAGEDASNMGIDVLAGGSITLNAVANAINVFGSNGQFIGIYTRN